MKIVSMLVFLAAALASPLAAADGVQIRDGLPNVKYALENGKTLRVTFLGSTNTYDARDGGHKKSYRVMLEQYLKETSQQASLIVNAANGGLPGMGSWLGAFMEDEVLLERQNYAAPLGLGVIELAAEDAGEPEEGVVAAVEGIVRQARKKYPESELVFLYTKGATPQVVAWHDRVADHYGIPSVNMAGSDSQEEYGQALIELVKQCKAGPAPVPHTIPAPLDPHNLERAKRALYEEAELGDGWLGWQRSPLTELLHVAYCNQPGKAMVFRFKGDAVGVYDVVGPDTGDLEFSIDGKPWALAKSFEPRGASGYWNQSLTLGEGLDAAATHELKLRVAEKIPEGSTGRAARVGFLLVNGEAVWTDPYANLSPLEKIEQVYASMPPVRYVPPADRWKYIPRSMEKMQHGELRIVMLGDSIVNDTYHSDFGLLLQKMYPQSKITVIRSVRGGTGAPWYRQEGRVQEWVAVHQPDLLMIGGISNGNDTEAIRDVIRQSRAYLPQLEVLVMTDVFGVEKDPLVDKSLATGIDTSPQQYRTRLKQMAAEEKVEFLDMTTPWAQYIVDSGRTTGSFHRDPVHANDRGMQILGHILAAYFAPKSLAELALAADPLNRGAEAGILAAPSASTPKPEIAQTTDSVDQGSTVILVGENFGASPEVWLWQPRGNHEDDVRDAAFRPVALPPKPPAGAQKARVLEADNRTIAAVQLGGGLASSDAVNPTVAWVKTADGVSPPYIFNAPVLWFLSDWEILPGERLRIFGRNLAPGNGTTEKEKYNYPVAFRNDTTSKVYWGQVLDFTTQGRPDIKPYRLDVMAPKDAPPGKYEVRVHVLEGGPAAWSNSLQVTVAAKRDFIGIMSRPADHSMVTPAVETPMPAVVEVKGLRADGLTDNTAAIQKAITQVAAQGGGLVVLPPGNLAISHTLHVLPGIVLEGAGRAATQLVVSPLRPMTGGFPIAPEKLFRAPRGNPRGSGIGNYAQGAKLDTPLVWLDNKTGLQDLSVIVGAAANTGVLVGCEDEDTIVTDTFIRRVEIRNDVAATNLPGGSAQSWTGGIHVVSPTRGLRIMDNVVEAADPMEIRATWATHRYARVEGNVLRNVPVNNYEVLTMRNIADSVIADNQLLDGRRAIVNGRGMSRCWIGGNTIHGIMGGDNGTEIMMSETGGTLWRGKVTAVDGARRTLTFDTGFAKDKLIETARQMYAYVVAGRGAGQWRRVVGNDDGKTLVMDTPWRVEPDTSSMVDIENGSAQNLYIGNQVSNTRGAMQFSYGTLLDCVIAGNQAYEAADMNLWGFAEGLGDMGFNPNAYNLVVDNRMVNSGGINLIASLSRRNTTPEDLLFDHGPVFANTVRRNQVWSPSVPPAANEYWNIWWNDRPFGLWYDPPATGGVNLMRATWNVVEGNFVYKNQAGVRILNGAGNVVRSNRFDLVEKPVAETGATGTVFEEFK